ncbi:MAG: AMP-binding protein [Christensenellaceae bacterium]|jgi:acetyl-CoA synthetase|nr:AMP-binding protein [Christensenellaceae bacterium]
MVLYDKYVGRLRDDFATLEDLQKNFKVSVEEGFNFAYDVVDVLAGDEKRLAMLWVGADGEERRFSFADLSRLSNQAANLFKAQGIQKGDMVMLVLKRGWQFWVALLGLHRLGAVAVPATNLLTANDYVYRCNAASVKMLVATGDGDVTRHIDEALPRLETVKLRAVTKHKDAGAGWLDFDALLAAQPKEFPRPTGAEGSKNSDMLLMFFSSGTTGYPKMVWHDYTYPLGHLLTGCFWHQVVEDGLHFTISDTGWGKSLWGKIYGQWLGGSAIFTYDFDRFNAADILSKVEKYKVTTFCAPPTMYRYMIKEDLKKYDLSALKHCTTAGEALNPEVYNSWRAQTGLKIFEGFGQTETTLCVMTAYPWMQPRLGSMGQPAPGWRLCIVDAEGGECAPGVTGEICVRTDEAGGGKPFGLFSGYFRDEEMTKKVWYDGLYHTGDTAYRDELGFFWYVGRVDDVIKSSGYRIGPFEVESAVMEHSAVLECAVTGVPDEDRGFVVKATIVLAQGYEGGDTLTKEIQEHVKRVTAPYKYPRIVEYVGELPKTISGKIRRVEIRENDMKKSKNGQ